MSERIATLVSNQGVITLILDGQNYLIDTTHPNYKSIKEALMVEDADLLTTLVDIPKAITTYAQGKVEVINGEVFYNNQPVHTTLTARIITLMEEGFPFKGMLLFLENLMQNPSARAITELYDFLENKGLPITDDGHFLAYKGIQTDWTDRYTGKINNSIGNVVEFERNQVDDDRAHECSFGLHVGALQYVRGYCTERVVIVKVNPKDVVSVPRDHSAQKVRVCRYEVLREYTGEIEKELPHPMYRGNGSEYVEHCDEDDPNFNPCDDCDSIDECEDCDYYYSN